MGCGLEPLGFVGPAAGDHEGIVAGRADAPERRVAAFAPSMSSSSAGRSKVRRGPCSRSEAVDALRDLRLQLDRAGKHMNWPCIQSNPRFRVATPRLVPLACYCEAGGRSAHAAAALQPRWAGILGSSGASRPVYRSVGGRHAGRDIELKGHRRSWLNRPALPLAQLAPTSNRLCAQLLPGRRLGEAPVLVACTQEAPLFTEVAAEDKPDAQLAFANIRETAGWSDEASRARRDRQDRGPAGRGRARSRTGAGAGDRLGRRLPGDRPRRAGD